MFILEFRLGRGEAKITNLPILNFFGSGKSQYKIKALSEFSERALSYYKPRV